MMNYWVRRSKVPIVAIVISDFDIKHKGQYLNLFEVVLALSSQSGWPYAFYMLGIAKFAGPIVKVWNALRRLLGKKIKIKAFDEIAREKGIPIYRSKDFNSDEVKNFLRNVNTNLIVSAYNNQILKRPIFNFPEYGGINIHPSLLPNFRGLDGPFEALYYGVKQSGLTIFQIDSKIDTGKIIYQKPIRIKKTDTLFSLSTRCWMHGAIALEQVLDTYRSGNVITRKQDPKDIKYPYQSFPTKQKVSEFLAAGKHLLSWQDITNTFKD
ncbi:MAG: hypothetical protein HY587_04795 [Candidatus Omnitrophica bacterium]|nr:hypothetical protein [Candidatus Omnitrophota bacterium]